MDGRALFFWVGLSGLLAIALLLGRWHAEELARRTADAYGQRAAKPSVDPPVRSRRSSRSTDAALPELPERASA